MYGDNSRGLLIEGVNQLTDKVSLGPRGRDVVLDEKFGSPTITKDGVTGAKEIGLKDPHGRPDGSGCGQQDVRLAGDGTTTGTVLVRMTC